MEHAIVIGGSMAGLLAARVLSDHFQRITLIERDPLPLGPEHRRGVPQGRHTHGLLASGCQALEQLFPGIFDELVAAGAISGDILKLLRWYLEGGCHARGLCGINGLLMSRPLLESRVRQRVLGLSKITCRDSLAVDTIVTEPRTNRVTGVRFGGESLAADLTVDASGRGSRTLQWLEDQGYSRPPEERVEINLAYTTRTFKRNAAHLSGDMGAIIPPTPEGKRGGVMLAQEDNRWIVTLIAHFVPPAPLELSGFIEYTRTIPAPYIYEVVRAAEPLDDGVSARFPASVRRRFEKLARFPEGFLVFGDAISSFNPIYGQGMSVACLQALALDRTLRETRANLAPRYFARASKVVDTPWSIAVGNDLRMPEAVGPRTPAIKFINWYMGCLHRAAHGDPACALAFQRVAHLLAPPATVMSPSLALRVLSGNLAKRRVEPAQQSRSAGAGW